MQNIVFMHMPSLHTGQLILYGLLCLFRIYFFLLPFSNHLNYLRRM